MGQDKPKTVTKSESPKSPPTGLPASLSKPPWGVVKQTSGDLNKTTLKEPVPTTTLEKSPLMSLDNIPRDEEGQKTWPKEMLEVAEKHLEADKIAEAEDILYKVRELAVRYGHFPILPRNPSRETS